MAERATAGPDRTTAAGGPVTLAQAVNLALGELLDTYPGMCVFGEDVGRKGGVYGVTKGLQRRFGPARVFDTLLDEQSILGVALGGGLTGLLPVPEIQYLAYLHNAEDQIRGEAATQQFFSVGQFRNPMVVRVAGYAYQKGFGGHFHNDNAVGALRDIPGLVIASPGRPDDAAAMLRTCLAAAAEDGSVCVFLEPIALYHTRDLHDDGDDGWLAAYPAPDAHIPAGRARSYGDGTDLTMVTFGNGLRMSLRVARRLAVRGIGARVLDLRWLAPLPADDLLREARLTGRVLVVDETRRTGGVSEGVVTALTDAGYAGLITRVTSEDSFIPLGPAANAVLLDEPTIEKAAAGLLNASPGPAATPARRRFLGTSLTLSAGAVALLGGMSTRAVAASADPSKDVGILNVALGLEHEAINAYQLGASSGLLQPGVMNVAVLFQSHHKGHRDALISTIRTLGGTPVAEKPMTDYAKALNAEQIRTQADILALAARLELLVHILADQVHRDVTRPFIHHLAAVLPGNARQLAHSSQKSAH